MAKSGNSSGTTPAGAGLTVTLAGRACPIQFGDNLTVAVRTHLTSSPP